MTDSRVVTHVELTRGAQKEMHECPAAVAIIWSTSH